MQSKFSKKGLTIIGLLVLCLCMPGLALANKNKAAQKKKPKPVARNTQISAPSNARRAHNAVSRQKLAVQTTGKNLVQAKRNFQAAGSKLAQAQKDAKGLSRDSVNAMPAGDAKNAAFSRLRALKWAGNDFRKAQGQLNNAQAQAKTAVNGYLAAMQGGRLRPAVATPPAGVQRLTPAQRAQQAAARQRVQQRLPEARGGPAGAAPLSAAQRAQQAAARQRVQQRLPVRPNNRALPPTVQYTKLPGAAPAASEKLSQPGNLQLALKRRLAALDRQQRLLTPGS